MQNEFQKLYQANANKIKVFSIERNFSTINYVN